MKKLLPLLFCLFISIHLQAQQNANSKTKKINTSEMKAFNGYFNFWWDETTGKIWLEIDKLNQEFLYVNSLPAGIGSNDIGLDRGQLGNTRVVKFVKSGPKILMVQPNYKYRAISDNPDEAKSVEQAFAQSVIWGFKMTNKTENGFLVDATPFLLRDAHNVLGRLSGMKQGNYKLDKSRSAIYLPQTKNFPKNSEMEATITFTGKATGQQIQSVTPSPESITVRMHHSFIELPDDQYQPRVLDPRSGFYGISYQDYATPIDQPLTKRFIARHRLRKINPTAATSQAVEPIIYYLDRGAPEPIKSALLEGASWWNQAFEAAGYKNAFIVKVLPEDADPMDIRYNLIQWVHRSTRGWSYGGGVIDPRTGEIIKGHVSLGSLRVRQDFLIAQGLTDAYVNGKAVSPKMIEMALARLRQLAAHEVGHTLGLTHNFAASVNDRSSVMDYPYPYITLDENNQLDFSNAYDDKIGDWDKRMIIYGYQDFPSTQNEAEELQKIITKTLSMGFKFIADRDARPAGGAHPYAHLWDNGKDATAELERLLQVRKIALDNFDANNIPTNTPMADLEEVLVPLYLAHRFQVEAVAKIIGGMDYSYAMRGDQQMIVRPIASDKQVAAVKALLKTIEAKQLLISEKILSLIPPKPMAYSKGRESFKSRTGLIFDPLAAAESASANTLSFLFNAERATRLVEQKARFPKRLGLSKMIKMVLDASWYDFYKTNQTNMEKEISRTNEKLILQFLFQLASNKKASTQANAIALLKIEQLQRWILRKNSLTLEINQQAHFSYALREINLFLRNPSEVEIPKAIKMPDGSPIGMFQCWNEGGLF